MQYIILVALLCIVDGGVLKEVDNRVIVHLDDDFPSKCKDMQAPCSCSDVITYKKVERYKVAVVEHVCDGRRTIQPEGYVCTQLKAYKDVGDKWDALTYRSGCELRYADERYIKYGKEGSV